MQPIIKPNTPPKPYLIEFDGKGNVEEGHISIAQFEKEIPFAIKRVFWTYATPETVKRGKHAHYKTQQVLIAVAGTITVTTELPDGSRDHFVLDTPGKGVFIPPYAWHEMYYTQDAVQLAIASTKFDAADYIRDYQLFKKLQSDA